METFARSSHANRGATSAKQTAALRTPLTDAHSGARDAITSSKGRQAAHRTPGPPAKIPYQRALLSHRGADWQGRCPARQARQSRWEQLGARWPRPPHRGRTCPPTNTRQLQPRRMRYERLARKRACLYLPRFGRFVCPHSPDSIASRVQVPATSRRISRTRELGAPPTVGTQSRDPCILWTKHRHPKRGPSIPKIKPRLERGDHGVFRARRLRVQVV
jgi:hypothetical protein